MPAREIFLIVEGQNVVADDLSQTVEAWRRGALVIHARDSHEAMEMLGPTSRPRAAILNMPTGEIVASGLFRRLQRAGSAILQITDETGSASEWVRLEMPFSAEMITNALFRLGIARRA